MEKELVEIELSGILPIEAGEPKYDYRKMLKYCKEKNKMTEELTEKELEQFITGYFTEEELEEYRISNIRKSKNYIID